MKDRDKRLISFVLSNVGVGNDWENRDERISNILRCFESIESSYIVSYKNKKEVR